MGLEVLPAALNVEPSGTWLGNDGIWSGFTISVGTSPQNFTVLPASNGVNVYVPVADDCARIPMAGCGPSRGVSTFNNRQSPGFQSNASSTWDLIGLYEIGVNRHLGWTGNGISGFDTLGFGGNETHDMRYVEKQLITAYATPDLWVGQIGLGNKRTEFRQDEQTESLLTNLRDANIIPSESFGYTAGAHYRFTRVPASLTLGGFDRSRASDTESISIPLSGDSERPLTVGVQSIIATNSLNGTLGLLQDAILAPIDSSVSELWLPTPVCEKFADAFGLQYHEASGRYAMTEATRQALRNRSPTLTITVADRLVGGVTLNLDFPYSAFDLTATYPIFPNNTAYFPLRRASNDSQYVIGRVFLQEAYLTVDYERNVFNVSQAVFENPMPELDIVTILPLNLTSSSGGDSSNSNSLGAGKIAGIVIGSVLGLTMILALVWFIWFRDPKENDSEENFESIEPENDEEPKQGVCDAEVEGNGFVELAAHHGHSEVETMGSPVSEVEGKPIVYEMQ